jgi:hypothetical protein
MKSKFELDLVKELLAQATGVAVSIHESSDKTNLVIRSDDEDFARPHGWSVLVEELTETSLYSFDFDNNAKTLQELYLRRCSEIEESLEAEIEKLAEVGISLEFFVNGVKVPSVANVGSVDSGNLSIRGKFIHMEATQTPPHSGLVSSLILFVGLSLMPLLPNDEPPHSAIDVEEAGLPEGASKSVLVNKYERNPRNRASCIAYYGSSCQGCGLDFGKVYGPSGDGFIHVHHLVPVSEIGSGYVINPIKDLVPLCPNCHAAAHLKSPPYLLEELRAMIRSTRNS